MESAASFRFYGSLNDFLPKDKKQERFTYAFQGKPAVKDAIEAIGVPHPEVAFILVNQMPVTFQYSLMPTDEVAVYSAAAKHKFPDKFCLQPALPDSIKFVLDVHLGTLVKALRMLGFDALYQRDFTDQQIAGLAETEDRIVLTRDVDLLKQKVIKWGYWLRSQFLDEQLKEVLIYYGLQNKMLPFTRCMACNGNIIPVSKASVLELLPPNTRQYFQEFYQCTACGKVYWKGSHYERMLGTVKALQQPD